MYAPRQVEEQEMCTVVRYTVWLSDGSHNFQSQE